MDLGWDDDQPEQSDLQRMMADLRKKGWGSGRLDKLEERWDRTLGWGGWVANEQERRNSENGAPQTTPDPWTAPEEWALAVEEGAGSRNGAGSRKGRRALPHRPPEPGPGGDHQLCREGASMQGGLL